MGGNLQAFEIKPSQKLHELGMVGNFHKGLILNACKLLIICTQKKRKLVT